MTVFPLKGVRLLDEALKPLHYMQLSIHLTVWFPTVCFKLKTSLNILQEGGRLEDYRKIWKEHMSHFPFLIEPPESKIWRQLYYTKLNLGVIRISESTHCYYSSNHYSLQEITKRNNA